MTYMVSPVLATWHRNWSNTRDTSFFPFFSKSENNRETQDSSSLTYSSASNSIIQYTVYTEKITTTLNSTNLHKITLILVILPAKNKRSKPTD